MIAPPPAATRPVAVAKPTLPRAAVRHCVYSTAVEGDMSAMLGKPHYSYRFAEAKFLAAFAAADVAICPVHMPEYHASTASLRPATEPATTGNAPFVHLIFRSTEQIRVLKPATNIACYAWEFEVMRDWTGPGEHPFLNQVRMLGLCDEIWVPCRFTQDVLQRHGVERVHVIPAPIAMPVAARPSRWQALAAIGQVGVMPLVMNFLLSRTDNARAAAAKGQSLMDFLTPPTGTQEPGAKLPLVYLSVLNPEDFRKNIDAMLRGFHHFQQSFRTAVLIVKVLTGADRFSLDRVISEVLPNKLASGSVFATDNIVFINRFLPDADMAALYGLADFYLCTSLAEGQNLPLLEAMAHGVVPVSTANTAMADYITPDNAFVIETDRVAAPTEHLAGSLAHKPFHVDMCSTRQVYEALVRSAQTRGAGRQKRADAAVETVRARFSIQAVWPAIAGRLQAAQPRAHHASQPRLA